MSGLSPAMARRYRFSTREDNGVLQVVLHTDGGKLLHSEYALLTHTVLATPDTVFQDKPHFKFGIVPGDGVHILWPHLIGSIRGRYFLLTRQLLDAQTAQTYGAVNEIVPADRLLARAQEIANGIAALPPLTGR